MLKQMLLVQKERVAPPPLPTTHHTKENTAANTALAGSTGKGRKRGATSGDSSIKPSTQSGPIGRLYWPLFDQSLQKKRRTSSLEIKSFVFPFCSLPDRVMQRIYEFLSRPSLPSGGDNRGGADSSDGSSNIRNLMLLSKPTRCFISRVHFQVIDEKIYNYYNGTDSTRRVKRRIDLDFTNSIGDDGGECEGSSEGPVAPGGPVTSDSNQMANILRRRHLHTVKALH